MSFERFTLLNDTDKFRVIANSAGEPGSGKTSFWLGAPGPIVILSFDGGLEGIVEPYLRENPGKEIYVATYDTGLAPVENEDDAPPEYSQDMAIELREKVIKDFNAAIRDGARTVVIDQESNFWRECSYAEFGAPKTGNPKDWDALKDVERRMVATARASSINLGMIQSMKNEWVSQVNKKTGTKGITQSGNRVPSGHDEIDYLMFHNLMHTRKVRTNLEGAQEVYFEIYVGKSHAKELQEQTFENLSFVEMAQLMFPTSTESDWV
jgi:hypothetical protein